MNEEDLLALSRAIEMINNDFYDRFDLFNTRHRGFYNRFDSVESLQVTLDYCPGVGCLAKWMGMAIWYYEDGAWPQPEEKKNPDFLLERWLYKHLLEQISHAAQYASLFTEDGDTVCAVIQERRRQDLKWGEQKHPDTRRSLLDRDYPNLDMLRVRQLFKKASDEEGDTFADILLEEVAEALESAHFGRGEDLYEELVQVAAVALQWAEKVRACSE